MSLAQLADDHLDGSAEEETGDHGLGEELGYPAHLEDGEQQKKQPRHNVIEATRATASSPTTAAVMTAPPATVARAELGPVAICLHVPKNA